LSTNRDAASAVQALYAVTSPYLKRVEGWSERWERRPCAGAKVGERWVPMPQPSDYGSWLELIMDGLAEGGVIFDETRVSTVGPRKVVPVGAVKPGPELSVGTPSVGSPGLEGAGPVGVVSPAGFDGLGPRMGPSDGSRTLGIRVQPGRRFKRPLPMDAGTSRMSVEAQKEPQDASGGVPAGFGSRLQRLHG